MMINCLRCAGQKKVLGIGMIEISCPSCGGLGKRLPKEIKVNTESDAPLVDLIEGLQEIPKKRGRPYSKEV